MDQELKYLWKTKRPEVTQKVSEAAALGDRSENAEYIYGKRQLREIDARIQFLSKRLDKLVVVDRLPTDRHRVYFGATVTLLNEQSEQRCYRIVGPDEFDREAHYISMDSPVARLLLKKQIDDEIFLPSPTSNSGEERFTLVQITYLDGSAEEKV